VHSPYADRLRELVAALDHGRIVEFEAGDPPGPGGICSFNGQAVMALYGSPPWLENGYAVRSRCLLNELARQGMHCVAVTRPNFPHDLARFRNVPVTSFEVMDGQRYERSWSHDALWEGPLGRYIRRFADHLANVAYGHGATVIHAASNHVCGLAAALAAPRVGARSIYEVRGLWHWSTINRRPGWASSDTFALHEALERQAAQRCDRIVVISEALADHVRKWGIDANRIHCIGNGVALDSFKPMLRDDDIRATWNARPESFVLGFVGTFAPYEGLDTLLRAASLLSARGIDAKVVLIGSGEQERQLRALARRLAIPVHFGARVPHHHVARLLCAMDCCPFPRHATGAALLVPPLKLGEAMACGVPVVAADCPPLTEMVRDGETGRIFTGGVVGLANCLEDVFRSREASRRMADAARLWITEQRSWPLLANRLIQVWSD
jgi:glycosyltransferase involved in cell wall biosynthesis